MKTLEIPPLHPSRKGYVILFETSPSDKEVPRFEALYEKVHKEPEKHVEELARFAARHSDAPEIGNLLAHTYLKLKRTKDAEALIENTYRTHPDYLIGRINYADQCLRKGRSEKVPEIFNGCFDLNALYPQREAFHFTEFRGFMVVMGFYHHAIGQAAAAEEFYELAFQVDPLHPSVSALEAALFKTSLLKKILKLACIFKKT